MNTHSERTANSFITINTKKPKNMKTRTIKQIGFLIQGKSVINLWGGGSCEIEMSSTFLPYNKATPKNILRCVNDGGFGCESIQEAEIDIYIKYDNCSIEYERTIYATHPIHSVYFFGWKELQEQGIN